MIVLTVHSFNGAPVDGRSAMFDELGGSIGRADTNQLVLPDPERSISRVHAQVLFRNGSYVLVDRGSNAVLVNGQTLGNGRESALRDGDRVQIGGYLIGVSVGQAAKPADPFADLFAETTPARKIVQPPPLASVPDPLARTAMPPASAPRPMPSVGGAAPSAIPDDWDPFAPDAPAAAAPPMAPASPHAPLVPDLPLSAPSHEDSLDALFGLGAGVSSDPLAGLGAAPKPAQPNTAADADPFQALLRDAPAAPPQAADHASELQTPWTGAPLRPQAPAAAPVPPAASPPAAPAMPQGAVFSWEQPSREGRVVQQPGAQPAAPVAAPVAPAAAGAAAPAPFARAASPAQPPAAADELMAALAEGLGMTEPPLGRLGPDEMRLIGQLLRESAQGAVQLLLSRAALKREMRAEVTVIAARENNPLKFSPSVEVALQYLLGNTKPGFMAPAPAMRDAFNDLRAHQLGMMAGMRSALEGVLQRFDPAVLEGRIAARRSGLSGVLPGSRKARLWELFQELYAQLSEEAQEDFHQLFGKAFLAAYEGYIDQLQSDDQ